MGRFVYFALCIVFLLMSLVNPVYASVRVWKNPIDGIWSDTNAWDPVGLPASGDAVYITNNGTYSISLNTTPAYSSLWVGAESGTQAIDWISGPLSKSVVVLSNGVLNLVSNAGSWVLEGVITNWGTVAWRSGSAASWTWLDGARLENQPEGRVDIQLDGSILLSSGAANLNNAGVFKKSGDTGNLSFPIRLVITNGGTLSVEAGMVTFPRGLTSSGTVAVASNASARVTGGILRLLPGHAFTGDGYYGIPSGGVYVDGPLTDANFRFDNGTLTISNELSGTLNWSGGTLAGQLAVATNGVLNLVSNAGSWALGGVITNQGTMVWRSGSATSWTWLDGARLENQPEGRVDIQLDGSILLSSGAANLNNAGVFKKSGGTGNLSFPIRLVITNGGTLSVEAGMVTFPRGLTSSGTVAVASNASARVTGGILRLLPGHAFTGDGYYGIPSGGVYVDGPLTDANFRFDNGTLTISNELSGTLNWSGGTLAGQLAVATNGVLNLVSNTGGWALGAVITSQGTLVWRSGSATSWTWLDGARLENQPGGLVEIQLDGSINLSVGTAILNNRGQFKKSGGTGNLSFPNNLVITNGGTLTVEMGQLTFPRGLTSSGMVAVASNASARVTGGTLRLLPGHEFTGGGYYGIPSGGVNVEGPLTDANFRFDNGTLTISNELSGTLNWSGGTLAGQLAVATNGVLNLVSNNGGWALSGTLANQGKIVWGPNAYASWTWTGGRLLNELAGEFIVSLPASIALSGNGQFINAGLFRKSSGAGGLSFASGIVITNTGLIAIESGQITFPAGLWHDGEIAVSSNAALRLTGGTVTVGPGHQFTGSGYYGIPSGAVSIQGILSAAAFYFNGGTLTLNPGLEGVLHWIGGTLAGSFVNHGIINISSNLGGWTLSAALTNQGAVIWTPGSYPSWHWSGARWDNAAGGILEVQATGSLVISGSGELLNNGTVRKAGDAGILTFPSGVAISNNGLMEVVHGRLAMPVEYHAATGGILGVTLWATNEYGRFSFAGPLVLTNRFWVQAGNGFRPPLEFVFSVITYPDYAGYFEGFTGIDFGSGLRLSPRIGSGDFSLVAVAYPTNQLDLIYAEWLDRRPFLWWPIALTNDWTLGGKTNLTDTDWNPIPVRDNNRVFPGVGPSRFFRLQR